MIETGEETNPHETDQPVSEQQQAAQRAKRFGIELSSNPAPSLCQALGASNGKTSTGKAAKTNKAGGGFTANIDLLDEGEVQRRKGRAERFETAGQGLSYGSKQPIAADAGLEQQKQLRAERFGTEYRAPDHTGQAQADLLEQRAEAAPDDLRRTNTLYMYGVDLMSTADCQAYLAEHGPVHIEWLNDSSCNAVLRDAASAARALVSMGTPLPPDAAVPDGSSAPPAELDLTDVRNAPYLWHKGPDFVKDGVSIALLLRMATLHDTRQLNSARTRHLWNLPVQQAQEKQAALKRKAQQPDGDEPMTHRKERGGARLRRQKRRQQDVSMADAADEEQMEELIEDEEPAPVGSAAAAVSDLRQLLRAQDAPGAESGAPLRSEKGTDSMQD